MSTHVPEFEVALAASDYNAIDEIWLNLLEDRPDDTEIFLALAEKMARRKEGKRAAGLLATCIGPLKDRKKWKDAWNVIRAAAEYHPKEKKLWDEMMEVVPQVFADFPEIDRIIEDGREDGRDGQVGPFLAFLDTYTFFGVGNYVEHTSGWGVGQVVAVSPSEGKLTVDFVNKKGHKFALDAASRMLHKLDNDHFLVWKTYRLAELQERCKNNPLETVKTALRSERNRSLTQREIKLRFVPAVMDQKTWSRFLTGIKKAAQADEYIRVGVGANPPFTLLAEAVTFHDAALDRFHKPGSWDEKLERARNYLSQINDHNYDPAIVIPPMVAWAAAVAREDTAGSKASGLSAVMFVAEVKDSFPKVLEGIESAGDVPGLNYYFDDGHPQVFIELLGQVPVPRYQRDALATIVSKNKHMTEEILNLAFWSDSQPLWEEAARLCEKAKNKLFEKFGDEVSREPSAHPDNFLWYARQIFVHARGENGKDAAASLDERYRLFEKLLVLATQLNHMFARGSKSAKASLQRLKTLLSEDRNFMLASLAPHITVDQAQHLYHHLDACTALGNTLPPKLRRLIRKIHPSVEAAVIDETGGYKIDPGLSLTTRRGHTLQLRKLQSLQDQLADNAKAIGAALELGDISENAELEAAREKEARLKQMLAEISADLKNVRLIDADDVDTDIVTPGCRVTWSDEETGEKETKAILGKWDSDPDAGIISYLAPIAVGLLGARKGDVVSIAARGHRRVRIEKIVNAMLSGEFDEAPPLDEVVEAEAD
ncbi:MAG: GreA/GreB family elongation factor [Planctomycetota bacterium]